MVSVVTLTFNNFSELVKTLSSLSRAPGIESVVINGGSCGKTVELLTKQSGTFITEKDEGIADAFNKGIASARGNYIAFLNSGDELIESGYYLNAESFLENHPEYSFVYSHLYFDDAVAGRTIFRGRTDAKLSEIGKGMPFGHPTVIVRKNVMNEVGAFNLNYKIAMDYEWVIRLLKKGYRGKLIECIPIGMDGHGVSSVQEARALLECKRVLREHSVYEGKVARDFTKRLLKFKIRKIVQGLFGDIALKMIKKVKQ